MVAIPTKPLHRATPLASTLGCPVDMATGGCGKNGFPMLQRTIGDITVIGAILNPPVAMN